MRMKATHDEHDGEHDRTRLDTMTSSHNKQPSPCTSSHKGRPRSRTRPRPDTTLEYGGKAFKCWQPNKSLRLEERQTNRMAIQFNLSSATNIVAQEVNETETETNNLGVSIRHPCPGDALEMPWARDRQRAPKKRNKLKKRRIRKMKRREKKEISNRSIIPL